MQVITEYSRHNYREINYNLRNGIVTEEAAKLIEVVNQLPAMPGPTYRTFWLDGLTEFVATLRAGVVRFRAFISTSRSQAVAARFNGNVWLTIDGKSGRDIAPFSDAPVEVETLFLPGCVFRVVRVKQSKIAGKVGRIDVEMIEV